MDAVFVHSKPKFVVKTEFSIWTTLLNLDPPSDIPADIAFNGYTPGSTGDPKAIVFTHERLHADALGCVVQRPTGSAQLRGKAGDSR